MARRRFFVKEVRNGQAEISGDGAHHLTRVLRVEKGQKFEITDSGRVWLASVNLASRDVVRFRVIEEIAVGPELPPVVVYLSLIKFDRFEWAVEKATELGVTRIIPVEAARSEQGLFAGAAKRVERWKRITHEASEQSRRIRVPEVAGPVRFSEALNDPSPRRIWLDEQPDAKPLLSNAMAEVGGASALIVGPEGGWTESERAALTENGWIAASLGPTILRAETAVCAALAVVIQGWLLAADRIK